MDWNEAIKYAKLVRLAELVRPNEDDSELRNFITDGKPFLGYQYLETLYASDLATDSDPNPNAGERVSFGFVALSSDGELVVAIRGTDTLLEWLHDAEFLMSKSPIEGTGMTDDGFSAMYLSLKNPNGKRAVDVVNDYCHGQSVTRVTICGHSLGAAMATLLGLDVACHVKQPTIYTYASPRVGDHAFANEFNIKSSVETLGRSTTYRIANRFDAVTMVPTVFPLPYEHVGMLCELIPPKRIVMSIPCMHHLTSYLWMMGQVAGVETVPLNPECVAGG